MTTPVKLPGTGLEDVRIPGQTFLRDALTSCEDPLKAIETFQVPNIHSFIVFMCNSNKSFQNFHKKG